jgi:hypothetical protein
MIARTTRDRTGLVQLASSLAWSVYIIWISAAGNHSYGSGDGANRERAPFGRAREWHGSLVPDSVSASRFDIPFKRSQTGLLLYRRWMSMDSARATVLAGYPEAT